MTYMQARPMLGHSIIVNSLLCMTLQNVTEPSHSFLLGTAIVTDTKAALWTDGRYYLQAEAQMDDNWTLMKEGELFSCRLLHLLDRSVGRSVGQSIIP